MGTPVPPDAASNLGRLSSPKAGTGQAAVVLCGQRQPDALLDSLGKRGVTTLVVASDLWAMAHACVMGTGTLVVICEPARLGVRATQLVLALRKYVPGVVAFAFDPSGTEQLRPVNDQDLVDWGAPGMESGGWLDGSMGKSAVPQPDATTRRQGPVNLRLIGDEPRPIGPSLPITEHTASASDVLTAEELSMLLGRTGGKGGGSAKGDQR